MGATGAPAGPIRASSLRTNIGAAPEADRVGAC
jgi:hypothetical protein